MAHQLFQLPKPTAISSNLTLLSGAKVEFFLTGTTTPTSVYQDSGLTTPHTNPVVADSAGRFPPIYLNPLIVYKATFSTSADVEIYTVDPVNDQLLSQAVIGAYLYPRTAAEIAAGVTPVNYAYAPGIPERYGNNPVPGTTDMTAALEACIAANDRIEFIADLGITTITWPTARRLEVFFNGFSLVGIATSATDCISRIKTEGCRFYSYSVNQNLNFNYTCATWWYDAATASQFNQVFGMRHRYAVRGLVYGELPGSTSTALAQSENAIFGFTTRGVQNPFYGNHSNGWLFFYGPMFVSLYEEWPNGSASPFDANAARSFENTDTQIIVSGGELVQAWGGTYAAEMTGCRFSNVGMEIVCPILINGDNVHIQGQRIFNGVDSVPDFEIASGVTGALHLTDMFFTRTAGVGAYSGSPLVDASAADAAFKVVLTNTQSYEWRWNLVGADVRLVSGGIAEYHNHRLSITAADPNIYVLNNQPIESLLDGTGFDRLGYTVGAGGDGNWTLTNDFGGGTTMTNTTVAGPSGYLASQITLHATGQAVAGPGDPTSLATVQATMLHVRPDELYWVSAWCNISSGTTAQLQARFYDLTGALVSDVAIADASSIGTATWTYLEGPIAVPATAAYMNPGVRGSASDIRVTDLRIRRAS